MLGNPAFDEHVVDIYLHISTYLSLEDFVDKSLVGYPYIFKIKWHNPITKKTLISDKYSFLLIFEGHPNLIVSSEYIHK